MNLSPYDATTCIYCGHRFRYNDALIIATNTAPEAKVKSGTVLHEPPIVRRPTPRKGLRRPPAPEMPDVQSLRYEVAGPTDPVLGAEVLAELACPKCRKPISPDEYLIALIGDTASGKSHYMASLIDQVIHSGVLAGYQCSAQARGDSNERYMKNYFTPLVKRREAIRGNLVQKDDKNAPLSFTLVLDHPTLNVSKELTFGVFDLAGEILADRGRRAAVAHHVNQASAMIFFVDPMTLPGFVRLLQPALRDKGREDDSPIGNLISAVVETYNRQLGFKQTRPLSIPVSITLSKSDLAEEPCRKLQFKPMFLSDERHTDRYDVKQAWEVSREVSDFLQAVGANDVLAREGLLSNVMYHAVSATGNEPVNGRYSDYEPIRCLDPFLWILQQWAMIG